MPHLVICFILMLFAFTGNASAQTIELPVVRITKSSAFTDDYEDAQIRFQNYGVADTLMHCKIKHRGGTTNQPTRHKRNYKFELSQDVAFPGMRNDDKWILDAGQVDLFRLRNQICQQLWLDFSTKPYYYASEPDMHNGCRGRVVELYINGEYRGIYNLMEPVDRKQLKLKKYQNGVRGLLYKSDSWNGTTFNSVIEAPYDNMSLTWAGWEVKYPEPGDDADTTDYAPLADAINFVTESSDEDFKAHIAETIDLPVFLDYTLFINVINGIDNGGKNMYWSIYNNAKSGKRTLVPTPWDMDATFGQYYKNTDVDSSLIVPTHQAAQITNIGARLAATTNWNEQLKERYAELRPTYFNPDSLYNRFASAYELLSASGAAGREAGKWSGDTDLGGNALSWQSQLDYIHRWINARIDYLDVKLGYLSNGVRSITAPTNCSSGLMYNLQGQRVSAGYHGIVIQNGRKYVK